MIETLGREHLPMVAPGEIVDGMLWHLVFVPRTEAGVDQASADVQPAKTPFEQIRQISPNNVLRGVAPQLSGFYQPRLLTSTPCPDNIHKPVPLRINATRQIHGTIWHRARHVCTAKLCDLF